jgi:hypothetical protein
MVVTVSEVWPSNWNDSHVTQLRLREQCPELLYHVANLTGSACRRKGCGRFAVDRREIPERKGKLGDLLRRVHQIYRR